MKQVLILGGGTGGAIVANLLARKLSATEAHITVISGSRRHYYQPGWLYVPFGRQDPSKLSKPVRGPLDKRVDLKTEYLFNLEEVRAKERVALSLEGTELNYDLLVMIPPHRGAPFLQGHPIADEKGWVKTDRATLQVKGSDSVWALGDTTDLPISKAGSTAHFEAPIVVERVAAAVQGRAPDTKHATYAGHVMCFMETGYNQATMLDFDYSRPPEPKAPNHIVHYLKMAFNKAYWQLVPTGVI